jgi:hypothetical protein
MALRSDSFEVKPKEESDVVKPEVIETVKKVVSVGNQTPVEKYKQINTGECPPGGRYAIAEDGKAFWQMPKKEVKKEESENYVTFQVKSGLDKTVKNIAEEVEEKKLKKIFRKKKVKK